MVQKMISIVGRGLATVLVPLMVSSHALSGDVKFEPSDTIQDASAAADFQPVPSFHVISARDIVDSTGNKIEGFREGYWTLDFGPAQKNSFEHEKGSKIVIFVHGYNTSLSKALHYGTALRTNLLMAALDQLSRKSSTSKLTSLPIVYLFLWRGDLGKYNFGNAQRAADVSSNSLADFIAQISDQNENIRIVLISHSLGARVALESLRRLSQDQNKQRFVDSLVIIQGAVAATSIYKWTATDILSESTPVESCSGRYSDSIRTARHLLYTVSKDDGELSTWFSTKEWYKPYDKKCFLPYFDKVYEIPLKSGAVRSLAIGTPFDTEAVLELIPKTLLPSEDPSRLSARILGYPREPRIGQTLSQSPFTDPAVIYKFQFRIDHPNVERLDLSDFSGIKDWHSPIFDIAGAQIVEQLWHHVLEALEHQQRL